MAKKQTEELEEDLFEDELEEEQPEPEPKKKATVKLKSIGMDDIEDDEEEDDEEEDSILDLTIEERKAAQKKLNSGEMLFPEDEALLKTKVKKPRRERSESKREVKEVDSEIILEVADAMGGFEPETANKKEIRALRKALQHLSLARYPKKQKDRKKFPKREKEVEAPVVKRVVKRKA